MNIKCSKCTATKLMEQGTCAFAEGSLALEIQSHVCCGPLGLLAQIRKVPYKAEILRSLTGIFLMRKMAHVRFVIIATTLFQSSSTDRRQLRESNDGWLGAAKIKLMTKFKIQGAQQAHELKSCTTSLASFTLEGRQSACTAFELAHATQPSMPHLSLAIVKAVVSQDLPILL